MFGRDPLADPERLIRRVYAYVAYRIGDGPEAEDATSQTFERALRYRKSYDPARGEPVSWLLGIARNVIAEGLSAPRLERVEAPDVEARGDLEQEAVERLSLAGALAQLDERERELIALRYGADLTARRIGELLGIKTNAAEVALHRALARLRATLEEPVRADDSEPLAQRRTVEL
ncbi:MAG: sigma-70 family RNA polymerase sigma factor [Actinobacteria bacterium]|nr:sigma-70 family RNA polymerase sigma factor [Actinomycetota bacterium]